MARFLVHGEDGQPLTGTLMDYLVPTAAEIRPVEVHHVDRAAPGTLGGFKGVGEGGTIGAPAAIAGASADALASLGLEVAELPVTAGRLFRPAQVREADAEAGGRPRGRSPGPAPGT